MATCVNSSRTCTHIMYRPTALPLRSLPRRRSINSASVPTTELSLLRSDDLRRLRPPRLPPRRFRLFGFASESAVAAAGFAAATALAGAGRVSPICGLRTKAASVASGLAIVPSRGGSGSSTSCALATSTSEATETARGGRGVRGWLGRGV